MAPLIDWLVTPLATTALVGLLLFLFRNLILNRLKSSVEHEFDKKLETLRAELRKSEEAFKADLHAKQTQIEVLRSGALSGLASRQAALNKRRLEAIDHLWAGIEALASLKSAARMMNYKPYLELISEWPELREQFVSQREVDFQEPPRIDVHRARPFVSEIAWALFSAYEAILGRAKVQFHMLKAGLNALDHPNSEHLSNLVKVALPTTLIMAQRAISICLNRSNLNF